MKLIIGNKNYSSWSLRPWLMLKNYDIAFEEVRIPLFVEGYKAEIEKFSSAGKVPVLHDGNLIVWDSLAICEYISEQYLDDKGWPEDPEARAVARACSAEMHSGFFALRNEMPMNCRANDRNVDITPELQKDIQRIDALWCNLRKKYAGRGPWLFGAFCIADCMFAPVVFRFNTYNASVSASATEYMATMLADDNMKIWLKAAQNEDETIQYAEVGG